MDKSNSNSLTLQQADPDYIIKLDKMNYNKKNIPFTKADVASLPKGKTATSLYASKEFEKQVKRNPNQFLHMIKQAAERLSKENKVLDSELTDAFNNMVQTKSELNITANEGTPEVTESNS